LKSLEPFFLRRNLALEIIQSARQLANSLPQALGRRGLVDLHQLDKIVRKLVQGFWHVRCTGRRFLLAQPVELRCDQFAPGLEWERTGR